MESVDGNGGNWLVVTELSHIKELVAQLEAHLGGSQDQCKYLVSQISYVTERSIGMIKAAPTFGGARKRYASDAAGLGSATPSPLSDVSDMPFKTTKKRKTMEKVKRQVRVSSAGGGGETVVDDGHSWRKYGQKEILGAKNPRGYYRCTHRHSQGCTATKQVQRTDEDPTLFDVIYHGAHTCVDKAAATAATQTPEHNQNAHGLLQNLSASLTVKTEGLAAAAEQRQGWSPVTPFGFSSTPATGCLAPAPERSLFSAPSTSGNLGASPATSGSNHVVSCFSPFDAAEWRAQSELQEVVSALVAAGTPEPAVNLDDEFDIDIASFFA